MVSQCNFCLFVLAIQQYYLVSAYGPGSLIWNRNLSRFIPISNVSTSEADRDKIMAKSRKQETHNFKKMVLKLGYVQDDNLLNFYDNDTKISGVYGEIWNTLAEYSNFTLVVIKARSLRNRDETDPSASVYELWAARRIQIIPQLAFISEYLVFVDFTTPIWETRQKIYIQPEWKPDANWFLNMFPREVLSVIIVFLLISSLFGYLMHNLAARAFSSEERRHNLRDHLFYTFATICSQGFIPDSLDLRTKFFGISKKIFAWLLLIICSAHLISFMTNRTLRPPFDDIPSLLENTSYKVSIYNGSIEFEPYLQMVFDAAKKNNETKYYERFRWSSSQQELYEYGCDRKRKRAIFISDITNHESRNKICELVPIGKSYFPTWVTFGVSKRLRNKRTLDIGILKMREFGLINGLKFRWIKSHATRTRKRERIAPVAIDQVYMFFMILCIGIVTSVVIFVFEIIIYFRKHSL